MMPSWDRRMQLMQDLGDLVLYMHEPFDWRVRQPSVLVVRDHIMVSPAGRGNNPYSAANDHWRQLTAERIVIHAHELGFRIWNGEIWEPYYGRNGTC
jgi:hypothetical protein